MIDKIQYSLLLVEALDTHQSPESRELMLADLVANLSDALAEAQIELSKEASDG